jgi:hypothetical protein
LWSSCVEWGLAGELKYSEKTCPSAAFSTSNPTLPVLRLNPGHCGGKLAANCLSYGVAFNCHLFLTLMIHIKSTLTFSLSLYTMLWLQSSCKCKLYWM